ncbi:MAG: sigma-70 family RNA polymerase sigma factor [Sandaracinobacter sp.]
MSADISGLLAKAAAGGQGAMRRLYDETSMKLLGVILRMTGNRADAEDVLQEIYVTVWRKAAEYDAARAGPWPWLVTIARHRAIDRVRARGGRVMASVEEADLIPDPAARTYAGADAADASRQVQAALGELDPRHAAVIRAAWLDGHSHDEISAAQAVPIGTIKIWVFCGLKRMRQTREPPESGQWPTTAPTCRPTFRPTRRWHWNGRLACPTSPPARPPRPAARPNSFFPSRRLLLAARLNGSMERTLQLFIWHSRAPVIRLLRGFDTLFRRAYP